MTDKTTLILIAGAILYRWAWHRVVLLLQAQGVLVTSPDLPMLEEIVP